MNARLGLKQRVTLGVTALVSIAVAAVPGSASALADGDHGDRGRSDHWGVITRNTIGSPVAALRNGPFGSFGVTGPSASPPYGQGSLGIQVANDSTSLTPPSERVVFGNEVDFYGDPVLELNQIGFHVFQPSENLSYADPGNMPNLTFEINPNLTAAPATTYSSMVWLPGPSPVVDRWSPYMDATTTGQWYLTGNAGTLTGCNQANPCTFQHLKTALNDGDGQPTIYTAAVSKGRDYMWIGAIDGLRINQTVYDFEADGVEARRR